MFFVIFIILKIDLNLNLILYLIEIRFINFKYIILSSLISKINIFYFKMEQSIKTKKMNSLELNNKNELINKKELYEEIFDKNMNNFDNKNLKNMYYLSSKILNQFVDFLGKKKIDVSRDIVENFILYKCNNSIKEYSQNIKKRNRKKIGNDIRCMGRKIDGNQCTRRKKSGYEYCQSHLKKLTNGRIDQDYTPPKSKNKRGRKRKVEFDPRAYDSDYLTLWEDIVNNEKVLIDINNNVYTFNTTNPRYLGKKTLDGKLIPHSNNTTNTTSNNTTTTNNNNTTTTSNNTTTTNNNTSGGDEVSQENTIDNINNDNNN